MIRGVALMALALLAALMILAPIAMCIGGCSFFEQEPVCSAKNPCPYGPLPPWNTTDDRPLYLANDAGAHDGADAR